MSEETIKRITDRNLDIIVKRSANPRKWTFKKLGELYDIDSGHVKAIMRIAQRRERLWLGEVTRISEYKDSGFIRRRR